MTFGWLSCCSGCVALSATESVSNDSGNDAGGGTDDEVSTVRCFLTLDFPEVLFDVARLRTLRFLT